jgi:hypothetical protein
MARERRDKSATESLLQIAVGLEIAVVLFGALAVNGLKLFSGPVVALGTATTVLVLLVLYRMVRYQAGRIVGHVLQLALLASFFLDFVIGLSMAVVVAFWVFGAIRGPLLDRDHGASAS